MEPVARGVGQEKNSQKPVAIAAKKTLVPFLEIATYLLLCISIFGAIFLKTIIFSQLEPSGLTYTFALWSQQALQNGVLAIALLLGFISLIVLPFNKKMIVMALMVFVGFLTRGLLS